MTSVANSSKYPKRINTNPQGDGMGEADSFHLGYCCPWRQVKLNCLIHAHHNSGQKILNPKATGTNEEIF